MSSPATPSSLAPSASPSPSSAPSSPASCAFCAIAQNKAPARIICQNEHAIAILAATPAAVGHMLVIPRAHAKDLFEISDASWRAVCDMAKYVANLMRTELHAEGVNIMHASGEAAQQSVHHLHLHLVPRQKDDGLDAWIRHDEKKRHT